MRVPEFWRQNLALKLLSLGLALSLWFFVHGARIVERELVLPIRYVNLADSLLLVGDPPSEARVQVSGPAQELALRQRFLPRSEVRIDLGRARGPQHHVVPGINDVALPANARFTVERFVEPTAIELRVERRILRTLPVRVVLEGDLAPEVCLPRPPVAEPAQVRCTGPATALGAVEAVRTRPVTIADRKASFTESVELEVKAAGVRCEPARVQVDVDIERRRQRAFLGAPFTVVAPDGGDWSVDVRPPSAAVTVSGPRSRLDALDPGEVVLLVDVSRLGSGRHRSVRIQARIPEWARLDSLEPATVDVSLHKRRHP